MLQSVSDDDYLFIGILIAEHVKAESWRGHFNELEADVFYLKIRV